MSVPLGTARIQYIGAGSPGPFPFNFTLYDEPHLLVVKTSAAGVDTTLALTSDYLVSIADDFGSATVLLVVALASGEKLTLTRDPPISQLVEWQRNDAFPHQTHERAADLAVMLIDRLNEKIGRAPLLRESSVVSDLVFPDPLANALIGWNSAATDLENKLLAAVGTAVVTPFATTLLDDASAAAMRSTLSVRESLTADRTYFVRTDGSDANDGLTNTSGGAFLTMERARLAIYSLDLNGFVAKAKLADGTYTGGVICNGMPDGSSVANPVIFEGNTATPANVIISTTNASCFVAQNGANIYVDGMELRTITSGSCMRALKGGQIIHGNVRFGASAGFHVEAADGGRRYNNGNFSIVGSAVAHQHVTSGGFQLLANCTVTLSGTPAFSQYFVGISGGYAQYTACTFSGAATGIRFLNHEGGVINTDGQSMDTYLPGNMAGVCVNATFDDLYDDLIFRVGGSLDWGAGDVNITHVANQLNFNGASTGYQFDAIVQPNGMRSVSPSVGVGYLTGAGGVVTQLTNKSTGVTLNRPCGQITMNNASLAAGGIAAFAVSNTTVAVGDTVTVNHGGGAADGGAYRIIAYNVTTNSFTVQVTNITGGPLVEALVVNFSVHKGAVS